MFPPKLMLTFDLQCNSHYAVRLAFTPCTREDTAVRCHVGKQAASRTLNCLMPRSGLVSLQNCQEPGSVTSYPPKGILRGQHEGTETLRDSSTASSSWNKTLFLAMRFGTDGFLLLGFRGF